MYTEGIGITDYRNNLWLKSGELPHDIEDWFDKQYEYGGTYDSIQLVNYGKTIKPYCPMSSKGFGDWLVDFATDLYWDGSSMLWDDNPDDLYSPFNRTPKGSWIKLNDKFKKPYPNYKVRKQDKTYIAYVFEMHS
tara:strand:+ start:866 stop:1270 length:405 start_codon:yes stop_codon:yes gene_type:complete